MKAPVLITDSDSSDDDDKMDADGYKQVSFSNDVEVLEIAPRSPSPTPKKGVNRLKGLKTDGIKGRLGLTSPVDVALHSVKRTVNMKATKSSPLSSKMMSDRPQKSASIHTRIDLKQRGGGSTKLLTNRIKNFKAVAATNGAKAKNTSVFNRLGNNK